MRNKKRKIRKSKVREADLEMRVIKTGLRNRDKNGPKEEEEREGKKVKTGLSRRERTESKGERKKEKKKLRWA